METDRSSVTLNDNDSVGKAFISRFGIYLLYTVSFCVVFGLIFLFFIKTGKSFIQYGDGYRQGYFRAIEFSNAVRDFFAGNGFDFWNWSAGLGRPAKTSTFIDPFNWITFLFVPKHIELGYTVTIILQMYFAGITFIMLAKKYAINGIIPVFGALCYVFSSWSLNTAIVQGHFMLNMVIFPLLLLGVEKVYNKQTPVVFSLIVAFYLIRLPYFAYMAGIICVIYIMLRYFAYYEHFKLKEYLKNLGAFVLYGTIGIMISMIVLISSVYSMSGASMTSAVPENGLLFSEYFYNNLVPSLMGTFPVSANYMYLGMSATIVLLFASSIRRFSFRNTPMMMSLIMIVFLLFPFFNKMFNGFSYPTGRWYYMMVFFIVLTATDHLQHLQKGRKSDIVIMTIAFVLIAFVIFKRFFPIDYSFETVFSSLGSTNLFAILINLLLAISVIVSCCLWKNDSFKLGNNLVSVLLIVTMGATVLMWTPVMTKRMKSFLRFDQVSTKLSHSVQRAGDDIDDDGFYRIDQVSGISVDRTLSKYANETLWWRTRSVYTYDSKVPSNLLYYNKLLGNNEDYVERVTLFSNDNRAGLDLMTSVKYFLGDDIENDTKMSQYAGYGFDQHSVKDGVSILKNKYDIGLGTGFDHFITTKEFEKLSRLEREQALLQAAVVSNDETVNLKDVDEMKASDVDIDIEDIDYTIAEANGLTVEEGKIHVYNDGATLTLRPDARITGQLMLSFDNLVKKNSGEFISGPFELEINAGDIKKVMMNKLGNQGIGDIVDYDVNLDYIQDRTEDIVITFRNSGEYTYDKMYLSAMDMSNYEKYAAERQSRKFEITEFDNDIIKGKTDSDDNEVLYFSIPADVGWSVYIDGEKQHLISDLNYAFCGVYVPEGKHDIKLQYSNPGINKGILLFVSGWILLAGVCGAQIMRRKRQ